MTKIALVGKPNSGKSTLFNRLIGKKQAITTDIPGTTRDWKEEMCEANGKKFTLIDTAGIELKIRKEDTLGKKIEENLKNNLEKVDVFVFVGDAKTGITKEDEKIVSIVRKRKKEIILVVNKIDQVKDDYLASEFNKLGLGEPLSISAEHNRNILSLESLIAKKVEGGKKEAGETKEIKVAILGRPNVGKSSFINKVVGDDRFLVSDIPGTTRDINSTYLKINDKTINLLDTAGLRRKGKIGRDKKEGIIEKFSADRVKRVLKDSDIALLLIDAEEKITSQDLHIAGYIKDATKGIIIVVNKWDLSKEEELKHGYDTQEKFTRLAQSRFNFLSFAPIVFVSALTGKNVPKVLDLILDIEGKRKQEIATSKLNSFLKEITLKKSPVSIDNSRVKIKYVTQTGTNPPEFTFFVNHPDKVHFSYRRYMENRMREKWDFSGTAIKILFESK